MRSQSQILTREDGKVHLEITFVSSSFKNLGMRDVADTLDDEFLIDKSRKFLEYDMVIHSRSRPLNNPYHL